MWLCVSKVESSQQPAEEAGPLGSEEADEEVNHSGDEDDACSHVVQVVQSFLIGHHVQVPAGYNTYTHTRKHMHTQTDTQFQTFQTHPPTCTHAVGALMYIHSK